MINCMQSRSRLVDAAMASLAYSMKYHKERGTLWVALIDPDEYITFNILSDDDRDPEWKNDVDVFDPMDGPDFTQMEYT